MRFGGVEGRLENKPVAALTDRPHEHSVEDLVKLCTLSRAYIS